jgi:hypothetical protein
MKVNIGYRKNSKDKIIIDKQDTWCLFYTLAKIIYPALIQYKETTHSFFYVEPTDVSEDFREEYTKAYENVMKHNVSDKEHEILLKAYENAVDSMIWSFSEILKEGTDDDPMFRFSCDTKEGRKKHTEHFKEIDRGLTLFGKYYRTLWD